MSVKKPCMLLWLSHTARFKLGLQTRWLYYTIQNMFTLHRLWLGSLLSFLCRTRIRVWVCTRVRVRLPQCKWAIKKWSFKCTLPLPCSYGLVTLPDSNSDSKLDGYIVLCRTCSHCTDSDSDPYSLFVYRTGIRVRVRLRQCKWAIEDEKMWYNVAALGGYTTQLPDVDVTSHAGSWRHL